MLFITANNFAVGWALCFVAAHTHTPRGKPWAERVQSDSLGRILGSPPTYQLCSLGQAPIPLCASISLSAH